MKPNEKLMPTTSKAWVRIGYCITVLVYATGFSALNVVLPFMFKDSLQGDSSSMESEMWFAFGMSGYSVTKSVVSPLVGYFSDRLGKAGSLTVMLLCQGFVIALMTTAWSFETLCVWRFLQGCFGTCGLLFTAIIPDLTDSKAERSDFHSYFINGWAVSKLLGGSLVLLFQGRYVAVTFAAAACIAFSSVLFQFLVRPYLRLPKHAQPEETSNNNKKATTNKTTTTNTQGGFFAAMKQATASRVVCAVWLLQLLTPRLCMTSLLKQNFESGALAMASMSTYGAAFSTVVALFSLSSWFAHNFGSKRVIVIGNILIAGLTAIIPSTAAAGNFLTVQIALAIVEAVSSPVKSAYLDSYSSPESIGAFIGFAHLVKGLSGVTSQFLASLFGGFDIALPFFVRAGVTAAEGVLFELF